MRFVPAHRQSDDLTPTLSPAKGSMEFVHIVNAAGREKFLDQSWIQGIIPSSCHLRRMPHDIGTNHVLPAIGHH